MRGSSFPWSTTLALLASRTVLFAAFQALVAVALVTADHARAWDASAAWWPVTATLTNLVIIGVMIAFLKRDGASYRALFRVRRESVGRDVLVTLGVLVASGVVAFVPNVGLATLFWGNATAGNDLFLRPLPEWAALLALVAFPVTIALAELPFYYGFLLPRVTALTGRVSVAVIVTGVALALQHATLPLLFDARFVAWRALMFLPFALLVGSTLAWRPRLLPFFAIAHGLLDFTVAWEVYARSVG